MRSRIVSTQGLKADTGSCSFFCSINAGRSFRPSGSYHYRSRRRSKFPYPFNHGGAKPGPHRTTNGWSTDFLRLEDERSQGVDTPGYRLCSDGPCRARMTPAQLAAAVHIKHPNPPLWPLVMQGSQMDQCSIRGFRCILRRKNVSERFPGLSLLVPFKSLTSRMVLNVRSSQSKLRAALMNPALKHNNPDSSALRLPRFSSLPST